MGWQTLRRRSRLSRPFSSVRPSVQGACAYCSEAYGVKESVEANDVELLGEFDGHPSIAGLIDEGYQVLTF